MSSQPFRSGYCNQDIPQGHVSHSRCRGGHHAPSGWRPCCCECHQTPEVAVAEAPTAPRPPALVTPGATLVTSADPDTPDWYAARRGGITGTDVAKILGLSRYGNALSVWLDKREQLDDEGAGEAAEWGQILEDPVAQKWAAVHSTSVLRVGVLASVDQPWMRVSLDRLVDECPDGDGPCALEVKTRSAFKADEWRDGIPDDVLAQTTWGLMVTGLHHHHVAALIGGQRMQSYRVDRDPVLEQYLLDAARPVWTAVGEGVPPEVHPDAEGVLLDLLDRLHSSRAGSVDLDPGQAQQWLDQYADGNDLERRGKGLKVQAKTALVQMLDDGDTGVLDDLPIFTYKRPAAGHSMPAEQVRRLRDARPALFEDLLESGFITETNPAPRFDLKKRATSKENAA